MLHDPSARWTEYEPPSTCSFIGLGLGAAAGGLASGLFGFLGSSQASSAAQQQEEQALAFEKMVFGRQENQLKPYLQGGTQAWRELLSGLGTPGHPGVLTESPAQFGGLPSAPPAYNYQAPTLSTFQSSPGYKWQLGQGVQAIQDAAGTKTGIAGGNTLQALQGYGTGLANQDWYNYLNNYNNQYNTRYQANTQDYWNRYNAAATQQGNLFSRFAGPAQVGQQAATLTGPQASLASSIGGQFNTIGNTQAAGILGQYGALGSLFNPGQGGVSPLQSLFTGGNSGTPAPVYNGLSPQYTPGSYDPATGY